MAYSKINQKDLNYFIELLGEKSVIHKKGLEEFSRDHTEDLKYLPELVLFPKSTSQVSIIVKYCNDKLIPITPSAALTGLSGGALPLFGGISLSLKKMNMKIRAEILHAFNFAKKSKFPEKILLKKYIYA